MTFKPKKIEKDFFFVHHVYVELLCGWTYCNNNYAIKVYFFFMCLFKAIIINVHFWRIKALVKKIQNPYNESSIMWNELFVAWYLFYVFNILSNNYGIIKIKYTTLC